MSAALLTNPGPKDPPSQSNRVNKVIDFSLYTLLGFYQSVLILMIQRKALTVFKLNKKTTKKAEMISNKLLRNKLKKITFTCKIWMILGLH